MWDFELETRFPGIDSDHRELDLLLSAFISACVTGQKVKAAETLRAFAERTARHFAFEERLMAAVGDRAMVDHTSAHGAYLSEMQRHLEQLEQSGVTESFKQWGSRQLGSWFREHIKSYDFALVRLLGDFERAHGTLPTKQ